MEDAGGKHFEAAVTKCVVFLLMKFLKFAHLSFLKSGSSGLVWDVKLASLLSVYLIETQYCYISFGV